MTNSNLLNSGLIGSYGINSTYEYSSHEDKFLLVSAPSSKCLLLEYWLGNWVSRSSPLSRIYKYINYYYNMYSSTKLLE